MDENDIPEKEEAPIQEIKLDGEEGASNKQIVEHGGDKNFNMGSGIQLLQLGAAHELLNTN